MSEAVETLVRLRGARKIYLTSIKDSERDILEMTENFSIGDGNSTIKRTSAKVSLQNRIDKVKQQDEEILKVLRTEEMENEPEEILTREENLQILYTRIEQCLSKPKTHVDQDSSPPSNYSQLSLPKIKIAKFNGHAINWQGFWDQFCSAIHKNNSISDIDKFS